MNENYEVVQTHEYQDIYRLESGVILKVNKYRTLHGGLYGDKIKGKVSKIKGIKDCFIVTKDIEHWGQTYPVGTIIFESRVLFPLSSPEDYWIELKLSGGAFSGSIPDYFDLNAKISQILSKYHV